MAKMSLAPEEALASEYAFDAQRKVKNNREYRVFEYLVSLRINECTHPESVRRLSQITMIALFKRTPLRATCGTNGFALPKQSRAAGRAMARPEGPRATREGRS